MSIQMNDLKNGAILLLILILMFWGGVIAGKYYFNKTDIKVITKTEYKTIWKEKPSSGFTQENFDKLLFCNNSPITFQDRTEKNYLYVTAQDACKSNEIKYEIGQTTNWKIYAGIGVAGILVGGYCYYRLTR